MVLVACTRRREGAEGLGLGGTHSGFVQEESKLFNGWGFHSIGRKNPPERGRELLK